MLSLLITASLTPVSASEKTLQDDGTYHIVSVEKDGTYTILEDCDTYARAKVLYTLRKRSYDNLAITYGSSFLSLEQGVVEFATAKDCTLNITCLLYTSIFLKQHGIIFLFIFWTQGSG